jgi:glyoxylase-like metal-dependent hydrolase (beta-lactamase superfamily II)
MRAAREPKSTTASTSASASARYRCPGKSPGEVGSFWQERNLLIVGDAVIGSPPYVLLPEKVIDDPFQLKQSLQAMLALDFDTLLVGDGSSIVSHGKDRLKELLASFHD